MSEPVTNVEIEDVLSSIRRLVSDEARAPQRHEARSDDVVEDQAQATDTKEESVEPSAGEGRSAPALVLTEALRVVLPEAEPDTAAPQHDETQDQAEEPSPLILEPEQQAAPEALSDAAQDQQDTQDTVEETQEQQTPAEDESQAEAAPEEQANDADTPVEPSLEAADTPEPLFEQGSAEEPRTIEDKIAALEALINRTDTDEFEPDGAEEGGNAGRAGDALPWEDSRTRRETTVSYPDPDQASEASEFDEGISAFERAREEAIEAAAAELEADAADTLTDSENLGAVLDEEALRDMVAEIVRQELQGPLGERITRNVRKLVRREIYRALAANELD